MISATTKNRTINKCRNSVAELARVWKVAGGFGQTLASSATNELFPTGPQKAISTPVSESLDGQHDHLRDIPPLHVRGLSAAYQRKLVLDSLDFSIHPGRLTAIIGPNGAGKSTLLKAVLGLIPASGAIEFWGEPFAAMRHRVGYVPQRTNVDWDFPITVEQVVAMGLYSRLGWFRRVSAGCRRQAREALDRVGLADFAKRQIGQLSGGQQQRVFLARALIQQADLYFMDEPMAGIDATTERVIFELLAECRGDGRTVVAVHHDLDSVPSVFDDCLLLNRELIACGPVADVFTPANLKATYGGAIAVFDR